MPIYEYKCPKCGHREELLVKSSDSAPVTCSTCGAAGLERIFSSSFSVSSSGRESAGSSGTCCGSSTPCASPKHCCGK
ncbi:MAG: zinc ribbon domain-containing protein [Candidatus Xenobiia bacterium LiM19]